MSEIKTTQQENPLDVQPLNEPHNRFKPSKNVPAGVAASLNIAYRALSGISAIAHILRADGVEHERGGGAPLSPVLADGLLQAALVIADMAQSDLCMLADWADEQGDQDA